MSWLRSAMSALWEDAGVGGRMSVSRGDLKV